MPRCPIPCNAQLGADCSVANIDGMAYYVVPKELPIEELPYTPLTHPLHTPLGIFYFSFLYFFHTFLSKLGIGSLINGFLWPRDAISSNK